MRSIPGTVTQYIQDQDQVDELGLTADEVESLRRSKRRDRLARTINNAKAELRALEGP